MKENNYDSICQKYINYAVKPSYQFEIIFAGQINSNTAEFTHRYLQHEIYYVINGRIKSNVNSDTFTRGDLLFAPPDVKHNTIFEPYESKTDMAQLNALKLEHHILLINR